MTKESGQIEEWQAQDAERLKQLFEKRDPKISQADFGAQFGLGSQGMVWQYLAGRRPLNIKAATDFARGLNVRIDEFSPTLASQIGEASKETSSRHIASVPGVANPSSDIDEIIELVALYQQATSRGRENILGIARLAEKRGALQWIKTGTN